MKSSLIWSILTLFLSLNAHAEVRLSEVTQNLRRELKSLELTACQQVEEKFQSLQVLGLSEIDLHDLESNASLIERQAFLARLDLRHKMRQWETQGAIPLSCVSGLRDLFRALRNIEESTAVNTLRPATFDSKNPAPYLSGRAPFLQVRPGKRELQFPRDLRSGDLLASRGNAPTSALIARLGDSDGQFSHVAMVYIHPVTHQVLIMEEHIEVGSAVRTYETYAADQNFRVTVYRHHDSELAARAAQKMYERLYDPEQEHVVPYDFQMKMDDSNELFCSEVAYEGFKIASQGTVRLGKYRTTFQPKNHDLLDRFGIRTHSMFAPSDLELEPNFEVLAEWRDVSRIASNQMMDAILTRILAWGEEGYHLAPSLGMKLKGNIGHMIRLLGFKKKELPTNMPVSVISTVLALDPTVNNLLGALSQVDSDSVRQRGYHLTFQEMQTALEQIRKKDLISYRKGDETLFHQYFHR
jgi:hypothetical protein